MKIAAVVWNSHAGALARAARQVDEADLALYPSKTLEENPERCAEAVEAMRQADLVFLYRSTEAFWESLEEDIRAVGKSKPVVCLSYDPSAWALSSVSPEILETANRYLTYGGADNVADMLRYLGRELAGEDLECEPPRKSPWEGLHHPDADRACFADVREYLAWDEARREPSSADQPVVGLLMARHFWVNQGTFVEDALVRELEGRGFRVLPAFSNSIKDDALGNKGALEWVEEVFLDEQGRSRIDALLKLQPFFLGSRRDGESDGEARARDGAAFLRRLDVPVLQPVFSSNKTVQEWEADPQGLGSEVAWSVAMPEFEGVIEPFYLGGGERVEDEASGASFERRVPHPERLRRLADRIAQWIRLASTPVAERKVAFILHNNPCASVEATVGGAAKLDSLQSAANILQAMRGQGYQVEPPADGAELIETIMERKAVSEFRWTTTDEIVRKGGVLARVGLDDYRRWFDRYPDPLKERISEAWGEPPGQEVNGVPPAMLFEGDILVTGVAYGNAVVCVQPKRGCAGPRCDGRVCKILHDPDIPPPHQYLATYRWLMEDYGAHAVVHVGTHGTLEFLPGKSVGLSGSCLPDVAIHDCPHLYVYNSDNPPEGAIAKRRSYAALVDHMQTVMAQGGLYEEMVELDRLLGEYEQAKRNDPARAHQLEHLIREGLASANLETQVKPEKAKDFGEIAAKTHEALSLVRNTRFDDGMHVLGLLPQGERRAEFIYAVLRYDAGEERSLRKTLCRALGLELADLLQDPAAVNERLAASHGELMERIDRMGAGLVAEVLNGGGNGTLAACVAEMAGPALAREPDAESLESARLRIQDIDRRLEDSREIDALLHGLAGGHVPAGPSGVITRGREDILPTGRNFYTMDPSRVPTRAAFRVGQRLAEALMDKHLREEGRYPENMAMFWMCNDMMWADGEGMGQILHLLGVRPVWLSNGRVRGFEVVPLSELKRPRIDVTIRVSGLLRDSFPGAMDTVDEAVQAVAALDEPLDMNFVRKHALDQAGEGHDQAAWRQATLRIFSARPGTYQAGVNLAVYASAWKDEADLSDIFVYWNSFAYGKGVFGESAPRTLEANLKTVDVTYNKVVSDEHDLFGCCAYYGSHGGMTAAARNLKGGEVKSYYGDTREPEHVQVRDLADEVRRVVRAKLLNPQWIEGMKRHGYKGAGDISKRVGRVYGWEAATQEVDDWIFDDITRTFVLDEKNREFFKEHNPWALEEIGRRLLEAESRGLWQADPDVIQGLKESYLEMEGWLEENMGDVEGDFQGGAVDVLSADDVEQWKAMMDEMKRGRAES
jgi:cobaltochelatase CobN